MEPDVLDLEGLSPISGDDAEPPGDEGEGADLVNDRRGRGGGNDSAGFDLGVMDDCGRVGARVDLLEPLPSLVATACQYQSAFAVATQTPAGGHYIRHPAGRRLRSPGCPGRDPRGRMRLSRIGERRCRCPPDSASGRLPIIRWTDRPPAPIRPAASGPRASLPRASGPGIRNPGPWSPRGQSSGRGRRVACPGRRGSRPDRRGSRNDRPARRARRPVRLRP